MKLKYLLYSSIIGVTTLTGCNDAFLERSPQNINDQTYWSSVSDLETYANYFYSTLPGGVSNYDDTWSDNQVPRSLESYIWQQYAVPTEDDNWSKSAWSTIRSLNYFMTHYEAVTGDESDINQYVGEIRFFRALQYFSKVMTYGDVPWLEEDLNTDSEELYGPRTPRNEVVQHIIEDLDFAIEWLPEGRVSSSDNRLTADVARHIKARVCLYEGTYYKYHTDLGYEYEDLLQQAVEASDELINSGNYSIYSTGDPEHDYYNMYILEDKSNLSEAILYIDYEDPLRLHNWGHGAWESNTGFSKDFIDSYLYADGLPKSLTSYPTDDATIEEEFANRDPRLKQMVLNNEFFEGNSAFVGHEVASDDAYVNTYCTTGYQTIKGYDPSTGHLGYNLETADGIAYRYAETLLINAEAKAELGDIDQTDLDNTINVLRDRVGMPHLTLDVGFTDPDWPDYGTDISPLLQEIRRERRIELAGEGFRWNDLCRWKAGELLENPMTYVGKKVTTGTRADEGYAIVYSSYTNSDLSIGANSRQWDDKMYLLPIPTNELQLNPELEQNLGW